LLKETVPKLDRLVYLRNPAEPYSPTYWKEVQAISQALAIKQVSSIEAKGPADYERAFATIARQQPVLSPSALPRFQF
jgi:hypothetical protein